MLNIVENDENMAALDSKSQIELIGFDAHNRPDTYVLKRDYVESRQSIPRDASGNVSDSDAFAAIERGYNDAKDHFTEQLFITPPR